MKKAKKIFILVLILSLLLSSLSVSVCAYESEDNNCNNVNTFSDEPGKKVNNG